MLLVRLLGGASIETDNGPLRGGAVHRHRLALLALLAARHPVGASREKLMAFLWPDRDVRRARNLLNQAVHALRKALGEDALLSVGSELRLSPDDWRCDTIDFEEAIGAGDPRRAVDIYAGPFLDGFFLPASTEFDHWMEAQRQRYLHAQLRALENLAERAWDGGDPAAAAAWWRRRLALDPHSGRVVSRLMESLAEAGDRAAALREAEAYEARMKDLGAVPEARVAARVRGLREDMVRGSPPEPIEATVLRPGARRLLGPPLIGRRQETERLHAAWSATARGPRLVLVSGEPGIGKSHLAEELLAWGRAQGVVTAHTRSYAAEGRLPYAPVADWLRSEALAPGLASLTATTLSEITRLLPELRAERPEVAVPRPLAEGWQRHAFFRALARAVLSPRAPTMLLIDDLQWTDPDTLQWLHYLMRFDQEARLLVVGTARMEETTEGHPLRFLVRALRRSEKLTEVVLGPLTEQETAAVASRMIGAEVVGPSAAELHKYTEGHPLFIVETVRAGERALRGRSPGSGDAGQAGWTWEEGILPRKVQSLIRSRLAQLTPGARELAGVAAAIGRDFGVQVLTRASEADETSVATGLDELWQRGIIRAQGVDAYDFSHDRLREVAHAELSPARRRRIHAAVAEALRTVYTDDLDSVQGRLARHYEEAGDATRAAEAYQRAGEAAQRIYANDEAIGHFARALALLDRLPEDADRAQRELSLRWGLAVCSIARHGWGSPDANRALSRARSLAEAAGDMRRLAQVLWGLQAYHLVRAELAATQDLGERLLTLAAGEGDDAAAITGHNSLGFAALFRGEHAAALDHLEKGAALFGSLSRKPGSSRPRSEATVLNPAAAAHVLWHLGFTDRGLEQSERALAMAEAEENPYDRAIALAYYAMLHQLRGEPGEAEARASAAIALCEEQGFPYYLAWGRMIRAWAFARSGRCAEGLEQLRQGLEDFLATNSRLRYPYYLGLLSDAARLAREHRAAVDYLEQAFTATDAGEELWHVPQLLLLRSALVSEARGDDGEAVDLARRALDMARAHGARSVEIRAAVRLCHLLEGTPKADGARRRLRIVYASMTEGFDAPDLREAHGVLWGELRQTTNRPSSLPGRRE